VRQNGDPGDHAAREFIYQAVKQKVVLVILRLLSMAHTKKEATSPRSGYSCSTLIIANCQKRRR
jgi:hypothetical protein